MEKGHRGPGKGVLSGGEGEGGRRVEMEMQAHLSFHRSGSSATMKQELYNNIG
jgi:hypothetical protein